MKKGRMLRGGSLNLCVLLLCSADRCGRDWVVSIPWPYVAVCDVGSTFFQERVSSSMYFLSTSCVSVRHIQVCCRFAGSRSYLLTKAGIDDKGSSNAKAQKSAWSW